MNAIKKSLILLLCTSSLILKGQNVTVTSPDNNIVITISNEDILSYAVKYKGQVIINPSGMGFELKDEPAMTGNFAILDQSLKNFNETWIPVVKSKHAEIKNYYNELQLTLKEKSGHGRQMELFVRAYNDGAAFRYKLLRAAKVGDRQIIRELTTFSIPGDPKAWVVEYGGYASSNEAERGCL